MPPKRKTPAKPAPQKDTTAPTKRRSKLAKENNITPDQETDISEAFALFSFMPTTRDPAKSNEHGVIQTTDIRRCLIALNAPPSPSELEEFHDICDPETTNEVEYEHFVAVAALSLQRNASKEGDEERDAEVEKAFRLFTAGQERDITIADLRRVARSLREDVPEAVLRDMLREATGGGTGAVGLEDFEGVMKRAGVFG
ncbi:hypothetical protein MBLNU230_g0049t1 [Neophaeotheca triangularis]